MTRGFHLSCLTFSLVLGLTLASPGHGGSVLDIFGTNAPAAKPPAPATNAPPPSSNNMSPPVKIDPTTEAFQNAKRLATEGRFDEALQTVTPLIQSNPTMLEPWILRGNIYVDQKKLDLAEKDYQTALQIDGKNFTVKFNLAEIQFREKNYDAARSGFSALGPDPDFGDLVAYKVFLCDLFGGHETTAQNELAVFNAVEANPSYYFGNLAWAVAHKNNEEALNWLTSAVHIYAPRKVLLYESSLQDLGYLPLPKQPTP